MNSATGVSTTTIQGVDSFKYPTVWVVHALRLLSVAAFCVACFLAWSAYQAGDIAGCGSKGVWDCGHVMHSRWSKWLGIPVGVPAAGLYLTMFVSLAFVTKRRSERTKNLAWCSVTVLSVMAGAAAVWFISLQIFILRHLCKYCMAVHAMGLVIYMLMNIYRPLGRKYSQALSAVGLAAISVLILGQVMTEPAPTYAIDYYDEVAGDAATQAGEIIDFDFDDFDEEFDAPTDDTVPVSSPNIDDEVIGSDPAEKADGEAVPAEAAVSNIIFENPDTSEIAGAPIASHSPWPQQGTEVKTASKNEPAEKTSTDEPRIVTYPGVKANLNVGHWPILGSIHSDQVVIALFDYTCPHCRNMSHHLDVARQRFGQQLSVVALPVPLDNECNETVIETKPDHIEACELARLAIAVWRIDANAFPAFHSWLYSVDRARTAAEAYGYAATIVDSGKLQETVNGTLVSKFINRHVQLYKRAGEGTLPKVLTEKMTIRGDMSSADELCGVLQDSLGIQQLR